MAMTTARQTHSLGNEVIPRQASGPVKAGVKIFNGSAVMILGGVLLEPTEAANNTTNAIAVGVSGDTYDNTLGQDGDLTAHIKRGAYHFVSAAAGDAVTGAHLFKDVYFVDGKTIANNDGSGTRCKAGRLEKIEGSKFYVLMR